MSAVLTREEILELYERRRAETTRWTNGNDPATWRPFDRNLSPQERAIARKLETDPAGHEPSAWDMPEIAEQEQ